MTMFRKTVNRLSGILAWLLTKLFWVSIILGFILLFALLFSNVGVLLLSILGIILAGAIGFALYFLTGADKEIPPPYDPDDLMR